MEIIAKGPVDIYQLETETDLFALEYRRGDWFARTYDRDTGYVQIDGFRGLEHVSDGLVNTYILMDLVAYLLQDKEYVMEEANGVVTVGITGKGNITFSGNSNVEDVVAAIQ